MDAAARELQSAFDAAAAEHRERDGLLKRLRDALVTVLGEDTLAASVSAARAAEKRHATR